MEENINKLLFNFKVPYNNEVMINSRKKQKIKNGTITLVCSFVFMILTILAAISSNPSGVAIAIFACLTIFGFAFTVFYFCSTNANAKDNNKFLNFMFFNNFLDVNQIDENTQKQRNLTRCVYRKYQNKQFVSQIVEDSEKFEIKIYTGTINLIPQYKKHILPKTVIKAEEMEHFKNLLKQCFGQDYIVR